MSPTVSAEVELDYLVHRARVKTVPSGILGHRANTGADAASAHIELFNGRTAKDDMKRIHEPWVTSTPQKNDYLKDQIEAQPAIQSRTISTEKTSKRALSFNFIRL